MMGFMNIFIKFLKLKLLQLKKYERESYCIDIKITFLEGNKIKIIFSVILWSRGGRVVEKKRTRQDRFQDY